MRGHWFAFQVNQWVFTKKKQKKNWVSGQTWLVSEDEFEESATGKYGPKAFVYQHPENDESDEDEDEEDKDQVCPLTEESSGQAGRKWGQGGGGWII